MKHFFLIILFIFLLFEGGVAQTASKGFSLDFSFSPEAGRWIYNRGKDDQGLSRGYDRSFLSVLISAEFGVYYHYRRVKVGVQGNYRVMIENELIKSQHSRFNFERYRVSDSNTVGLSAISVALGFDLVRYPRYHLIPQISLGTFFFDTVHPEKENFGFRLVWSAGFINEWEKGRFSLFIHPHFTSYLILPKDNLYPDELNQIYSLGAKFGIRYWLVRRQ